MNQYVEIIEKKAGVAGKLGLATKDYLKRELLTKKNAKKALAIGTGLGTAGAGYLLANDKQKEKIKEGTNFVRNGMVAGGINGLIQDGMKVVGAAAGTAYGVKKGKPIGKALASSGLAGTAIGDLVGAATIPTAQLYNQHKKEFGTAPDIKSLGTLAAANLGPTAAIWGGLYGTKKGLQNRKAISKSLTEGADKAISAGKKISHDLTRLRGYDDELTSREARKIISNAGSNKEFMKNLIKERRGTAAADYLKLVGGGDAVDNRIIKNIKDIASSVGGIGGAFAPIAVADQLAGYPAAAAAPRNIIDIKKKIIENNSQNNEIGRGLNE